jgi:neutral ceramidase
MPDVSHALDAFCRRRRRVAGLLGAALALWVADRSALGADAARIRMGAAGNVISPPIGTPLIGYPTPRPNTGVGLDLMVRAAVFGPVDSAKPSAALVVFDLLHVDRTLGEAVRAQVAKAVPEFPASAVLVCATHTHSGPSVTKSPVRFGAPATDEAYFQSVVAAAGDAVATAWRSSRTVTARFGRAAARLGSNRRVVLPDGTATNFWKDPEGLHPGYFNPDAPFLIFEDTATHAPAALIFSFGCHPVVLGPGNARVSADYPGYAVRALEQRGKIPFVLAVTGAAGDINPRDCLNDDATHAWAVGDQLAGAVLEELPSARAVDAAPIAVASAPLRLVVKPAHAPEYAGRLEPGPDGPMVTSEVQALRLGDCAFVGSPGELVSLLGAAVQNGSPFPHTFIAYNANDHLGYIVSNTIRREGGYEARSAIADDEERLFLAAARAALAGAAAAGGKSPEKTGR